MSAELGAESTAANLNLTPEEKRVYGDLFKQADPENLRVVTGDAALGFFDKTRLDSRVLGEIWQMADRENRGFLTPAGFGIVLRLIGHAQAGREPRPELAFQQGPLPRFDGIQLAASPSSPGVRMPPLTPDKVAQYATLFERQPLQGNMLSGDQARQIFDKSSLPNETLGRIWALADTEQRGALVLAEFVIAMHLLTSMKTGALRALPAVLPAGLYEAATQRAPPRLSPNNTGMSASAIPRQLSGSAQPRTGSPLGRPPLPAQTGADWAITPAEKERFDQLYATLDKTKKGYITGDEAVPFFSQSNLSEDVLAQIWDLADFNSQGQLTTEGFAVAMYLIRQQRSGRSVTLPAILPPNLIPPSARGQQQQRAFDPPPMTQPPPPQPKSALDDLFGLDSGPSTAPAPAQATMSTGGSIVNDPFGAPLPPTSPVAAAATGSAAGPGSSSTFKPFVPSSSFGRGLTTKPSADAPKQEDLLEDDDPEATSKISGETTELANLSNQVGSLSKQMQDVQTKRTAAQNELNQTNSQKQNFEQRLAQLRTLYEKEAESLRELEEQLKKSREETQKLQGECMTLEGTLRDQQSQQQQVSAALQADKQENASLRERIRAVNGEVAQLRPQIEKLKTEARQQKGLVAINKKQQATTEGDRDKLKAEAEALAKGDDVRADSTSPVSAQVVSPALSTASANNPFFKRTGSADVTSGAGFGAAPPRAAVSDKSFDDVFGPSPPTASKQQHTGNSAASGSSLTHAHAAGSMTTEAQPPPPPESKQITSSFLPFPDHSESLSSSRQVSPPASRVEGPTSEAGASSATPVTKAAETPSFSNGNDNAKAKADFDDAFASFATTGKTQTADGARSQPGFASEFPPISELEHDDESDSNSERGGFDDDFSPTPQQASKAQAEPAAAKEKEHVVSSEKAPSNSKTMIPPAVPKKTPEDLDDDFEGLEEAKEGSADDDFANMSHNDFNPVFDTSPPASQAMANESSFDMAVEREDARVKGLTSMGYTRSQAVSALEKYDYNLERAANFLASQS
ncbi:EF hand domain protein [Ophiocordyceps camponoti-floridani]|uniref:EF hand domain protein n=1 Tax=Ophiocordyceps camponoti-floridani TaxID=2030778 RepID=A0A8H4Q3R0_9HYPO|nr:EF hand domain protein [Ophiocordyceps camponoti-floridani]